MVFQSNSISSDFVKWCWPAHSFRLLDLKSLLLSIRKYRRFAMFLPSRSFSCCASNLKYSMLLDLVESYLTPTTSRISTSALQPFHTPRKQYDTQNTMLIDLTLNSGRYLTITSQCWSKTDLLLVHQVKSSPARQHAFWHSLNAPLLCEMVQDC